jgi:hypothetical protein
MLSIVIFEFAVLKTTILNRFSPNLTQLWATRKHSSSSGVVGTELISGCIADARKFVIQRIGIVEFTAPRISVLNQS